MATIRKYIDIGANLTDLMYQGIYNRSKKHEPDLENVLSRSWNGGLDKIIITAGNVSDAKKSLEIANTDDRLFTTVGCHPTRCSEFLPSPEGYLASLRDLIRQGAQKIVAIGECGLDYDRLHFCDKEVQKKFFEYQLVLCQEFNLPLFLHCRAAADDFFDILEKNKTHLRGGVVHSFDGDINSLKRALALGFSIGLNGCSLRQKESLEVVKEIPSEKIMIETDSPWCEVKQSHAGYNFVKTHFTSVKKEKHNTNCQVKGRNEPVNIVQVLEILAGLRNENIDELADTIHNNTKKIFFPSLI